MYNKDLEARTISLDNLFLDPNNPRFPEGRRRVTEKNIADEKVQKNAEIEMGRFNIDELANSIIRSGFLPLDRIVVREIKESPGNYVVLEGNRRLTALRRVVNDINRGQVDAEDLEDSHLESLLNSISSIECLVYTGTENDIAWILQGVRHLSGIHDWQPAQKARLVAKEAKDGRLSFGAIGQMLGMTAHQVGRFYRIHCSLEQMRADPDFGDRYDPQYFTLMDEALSKRTIKSWLGWDDKAEGFINTENLQQFYSWITPDPDHENERRLHNPRQMKILAKLVDPRYSSLMQQVDDWDISLELSEARMNGEAQDVDWSTTITSVDSILNQIPLALLQDDPEGLSDGLRKIQRRINWMLQQAEKAKVENFPNSNKEA